MKKQAWYESWFDSPYYHRLYEEHDSDEASREVEQIVEKLNIHPPARILDVACGRGRHAIDLAGKGFLVTGVDLSWKNILHASRFEQDNLTFFEHDMRNMFYVNYFDVVLNLFTSFGYFENEKDNIKAMHTMSVALKPGGKLVLDFFNSVWLKEKLIPAQLLLHEGILFDIRRSWEQGFVRKKIYFQDQGREYNYEERVKTLTLDDFMSYFQKSNLKLIDSFGDYSFHPFDSTHSERMILIAEKM